MGGVLGGLAGFREKPEQAAGIRRRFDLGQPYVSGNDGENVVQIVRDSASQGAERFEFAGREPFCFGFLALTNIPDKNRNSAVAAIGVNVIPNLASRVRRFEFDRNALRHHSFKIGLESRSDEPWELF